MDADDKVIKPPKMIKCSEEDGKAKLQPQYGVDFIFDRETRKVIELKNGVAEQYEKGVDKVDLVAQRSEISKKVKEAYPSLDSATTQKYIDMLCMYVQGYALRPIYDKFQTNYYKLVKLIKAVGIPIRTTSDTIDLQRKNDLATNNPAIHGPSELQKEKLRLLIAGKLKDPKFLKSAMENSVKTRREHAVAKHDPNSEFYEKFQKRQKEGLKKAAQFGSKAELEVCAMLEEEDYIVQRHPKLQIAQSQLTVDLLLPQHKIAIEIDGPTHFDPAIRGPEVLQHIQEKDHRKDALLIMQKYTVIRLQFRRIDSKAGSRRVKRALFTLLNQIMIAKQDPKYVPRVYLLQMFDLSNNKSA